jgi:tRNA(Ile2) C34 agmatinyltransferase TiaS
MAETNQEPDKVEESTVVYVKPEENPCPQCGGPMVWVSGGPRCKNCGFKESCCF